MADASRRAFKTEGRIIDGATGDVLATADGMFMALPEDQVERLKARYGMRRAAGDSAR